MLRRAVTVLLVGFAVAVCADTRPVAQARVKADRARAEAYLRQHWVDMGLRNLEDLREIEGKDLRHESGSIFRYQQYFQGVSVYGAQLVATVHGNDIRVTDRLIKVLEVDITPAITEQQATKIATSHRRLKGVPDKIRAQLLILPKGSITENELPLRDRLAWMVDLETDSETDPFDARTIYVDAHTGEVIYDMSGVAHLTFWLGGPPIRGMYATRQFNLYGPVDNEFVYRYVLVRDPCYGTGLSLAGYTGYVSNTPDARVCGHAATGPQNITGIEIDGEGNWVGDSNGRYTTKGSPLKIRGQPSAIGTGILGATDGPTAAADAFNSMYLAFRYLELSHAHEGLDGTNGPVIRTLVRQGMDGATWVLSSNAIQVGRKPGHYPLTSLDVIAHELGHGLSDYGPKLNLIGGESPKLSEANSDMFALLVSDAYQSGHRHDAIPSWIGELTFATNYTGGVFNGLPTDAIRYMDDPAKTGGVACYYSGIAGLSNHAGAGPADHMFHLLTYGGTSKCDGTSITGIGAAKSGQIWYGALNRLFPAANYADLRLAFVDAAQFVFPGPSVEIAAVEAAFNSVQIP